MNPTLTSRDPDTDSSRERDLHQLEVQRARLRIVLDRKQGFATPDWVYQLAGTDPRASRPASRHA